MSYVTKLSIKNKEFNLIRFSFSLKKETDSNGRPSASIQCGLINIELSSFPNNGMLESISDKDNPLQGKIIYYDVISDQKIKEIEFYNGYVILYEELFNVEESNFCVEKITISAEHIRIGKDKFENNWLL